MLGTGELIIIFLVVLLLFGGKRLPELAKSLGAGIREFKRACNESDPVEPVIKKSDVSIIEDSDDKVR